MFIYIVATNIMSDDHIKPFTIVECRRRMEWPQWKQAIYDELDSLVKIKVFGHVAPIQTIVISIGNKWVYVRKRNENNDIVKYKNCLMEKGFSQRPRIDYEETYSPIMDVITCRYLIILVVFEKLNIQLVDVVTVYLLRRYWHQMYMRVTDITWIK